MKLSTNLFLPDYGKPVHSFAPGDMVWYRKEKRTCLISEASLCQGNIHYAISDPARGYMSAWHDLDEFTLISRSFSSSIELIQRMEDEDSGDCDDNDDDRDDWDGEED